MVVFATVLVIKPVGGVVAAGVGSTWLAICRFREHLYQVVMLFVVVLLSHAMRH
jgi:hypothetical protein